MKVIKKMELLKNIKSKKSLMLVIKLQEEQWLN